MAYAMNEISQIADKHNTCASELGFSLTLYSELAAALEKYGKPDEVKQVTAAFKGELQEKARLQASSGALKVLVEKMTTGRMGTTTAENVGQMYLDIMAEKQIVLEKAIDKSDEAIEFKKAIWEAGHPDEPFVLEGDDDLAMVSTGNESSDSLICPITRMELVEPYKNVCGHIFSKEAIFTYLKQHRGRRSGCPVAGCPKSVAMDTLTPDVKTQQKLANQKKRKRTDNADQDVEDL